MQSKPKLAVRFYRCRLNLSVVIRDKSQPPYKLCQSAHLGLPPEPKNAIPVAFTTLAPLQEIQQPP
jgi:hypothetical protein